jgi:CRISPR-associated protein Cas1
MLKKTLFFQSPCHLAVSNRQLKITIKKTSESEIETRPVEDIGFIILDNSQITFTQSVIQLLAEHNAAVVFCDEKHHPTSMLFHLDTHQTQTAHFKAQIEAAEPLKKQLWQQTIKAKIKNQAAVLDVINSDGDALRYLAKKVKSGDSDNIEARASRYYWPNLFGKDFLRRRFGEAPNHLLNYGYTILRAAVARALTGSGLLPTLGIHHRNKYNAFCLADDIMEPYRPFVDLLVLQIRDSGYNNDELTTEIKKELLQILTIDVHIGGKKRPLTVALSESTASLSKCYMGTSKKMKYPEL